MDTNRRTHPDCKYSRNPFHECASDCVEKIAQGNGKKNSKKQGIFFLITFSLLGDRICSMIDLLIYKCVLAVDQTTSCFI